MTDEPTITSPRPDDRGATGFQIPGHIGPVSMIRPIGAGGMGVVWLGHHELLGLSVAVKLLTGAAGGRDDEAVATFIEGARAAVAVRHPALTSIYHADVVESVPYLVMEFIDGPTLADVIQRTGPLSLAAALAALEQICEAVGALHDHDIIHRDIKPSNVLLDRSGRIAVTDFGLAFTRSRSVPGAPTLPSAGTPGYMAPELNAEAPSVRTDMYALGVTAFVLLTGELPWSGVRPPETGAGIPIEPLDRRAVPEAVAEAIDRAVHAEPRLRHKSVRNFLAALSRAVPDRTAWERGRRELESLAGRAAGEAPTATADRAPSSSSYAALEARAASKRAAARESPDPGTGVPSQPTGNVLIANLPCVKCGYSLRGLGIGARCPECGTPLAETLEPRRLIFADRAWLRRQQYAMTCLAAAGAFLFLLIPIYLLLSTYLATILAATLVVSPVLLCAGTLFLARREPSAALSVPQHVLRITTALLGPATIVTGLVGLVGHMLERPMLVLPMVVANSFCFGLTTLLMAVHMVGLTRRIPSRKLVRFGFVAGALSAASLAIMTLARLFSLSEAGILQGLWLLLELLAEFLLLALLVSVASRLRKELRSIRKSARSLGPLFAPTASP